MVNDWPFVSMEPVVKANAYDIVGDLRTPAVESDDRICTRPAEGSEVDVEVFNFPSPIARIWKGPFDTGAQGPTKLGLRVAD